MKKSVLLAMASVALTAIQARAEVDCLAVSLATKQAIVADQARLLEVVSAQVAAAPACSCEIVKSAIEISKANAKTVASIVEVAATAAPEQMRLISQCAVAVAPDALGEVQAVMAKLDPNSGESGRSAKSAKSAKQPAEVADIANPLDRIFQIPSGFYTGLDPLDPRVPPVVIAPPEVTPVNSPNSPE